MAGAVTKSEPGVAVYVGLGSNLDEPLTQIGRAVDALRALPGGRLVAVSPLYRSRPLGPADQPDYINAVAWLESTLMPWQLLRQLQAIEQRQGRVRSERWGPRTLDLDLLLYGDRQIESIELIVPHPGLKLRNFVLVPLADIAPDLRLPDGTPVARLAAECTGDGLCRIAQGGTAVPAPGER